MLVVVIIDRVSGGCNAGGDAMVVTIVMVVVGCGVGND